MSPSPLPVLQEMQRRFRAAVLGSDDAPVADFIHGAHGETAARIGVYRNTVQASLIDVLATAFPVTQRILGERFFSAIAARFIVTAPPRVPQLSLYGDGFTDFLAGQDVAQQLSYLPDVARLEWARGESYFAADAPPLNIARLAALSPEDMDRIVLGLHPATRMISSKYPIYRIWEVNQLSVTDVPAVDMSVGQRVLVSRRDHHLVTRALDKFDAAFVSAIAAGKNLSAAAAGLPETFDLQQALQNHFINGTFTDT